MKKFMALSAVLAVTCTMPAMAAGKPSAETKAQIWISRADLDKDGKVSLAEDQALCDASFRAIDTDKSGDITLQEFTANKKLEMKNEDHAEQKAQFWFRKMDTNNDGKITRDEARAFGDAKFAAADTDNDGYITLSEATAAIKADMQEYRDGKGSMYTGSKNSMKGSSTVNLPNRTNANPTDHSQNPTNPSQDNR